MSHKKKRKSLLIYTTPDKQSAQTCGCHPKSMQSMRSYFIHVCTESYAPDSRPQLINCHAVWTTLNQCTYDTIMWHH